MKDNPNDISLPAVGEGEAYIFDCPYSSLCRQVEFSFPCFYFERYMYHQKKLTPLQQHLSTGWIVSILNDITQKIYLYIINFLLH